MTMRVREPPAFAALPGPGRREHAVMPYACSACEARQDQDTTCRACGHLVVLDLQDPACVERLRDEQRRRRDKLLTRCRALGVIGALPITLAIYLLFAWGGVMQLTGTGVAAVLVGVAAVFITALERTYGARRFFPYLDSP